MKIFVETSTILREIKRLRECMIEREERLTVRRGATRGFGSMNPEKRKELARKGGFAKARKSRVR